MKRQKFRPKFRPSLRRDFTLLMLLVLFSIGSLCYYFTYMAYREQSELIENRLRLQSERIEMSYEDLLDFTEKQVQYIARRIYEHGPDNEFIEELLHTFATPKDSNSTWSTFLWCDATHTVRVTNDFGILDDIRTLSGRDYITQAVDKPNSFHLGKPVYGITSGNWIIPGGIGLTNPDGTYMGTVVTGLIITKLIHYLEKAINVEGVSFGIFHTDLTPIAASTGFLESTENNHILDKLATLPRAKQHPSLLIPTGFSLMSGYGVIQQLGNAPFLLIISYDKHLSDRELRHLLVVRLFEICSIGGLALFTLLLLKYRLISPLAALSSAAQHIAQEDKRPIKLPHSSIIEIHTLARHILRLKRQMLKIRRIERHLFQEKTKAEQANIARSEFLASMSHELRTPLNAIIGYSEMMHNEILGPLHNPTYAEYAKDIHASGMHLLRLINEILDISQAKSDHFELCEESVNVLETVHHALSLLQRHIIQKHIAIHIHAHEPLPLLYADKTRISQIFFHVLSNAVKFSKSRKSVNIHLFSTEEGFHISIQDYGIGMASSDIPLALQKFSQLDSSIARVEEGIGIGLWLTRLFVDIHQGTLTIESIKDIGTTITIIFPPNRIVA